VPSGPTSDTPPSPSGRPDLATEADVDALVRRFYRRARADDVLGPVFAAADLDWDAHIGRVTAFWTWQLLGGRRYDGRPLRSHRRVHDLVPFTEAHYERWLALFSQTLRESWDGPVAALAEQRAGRMARSMRRVLAGDADPDPSWPEEGEEGLDDDGASSGPSGGLVMRVALGPRRTSDEPRHPGPSPAGPADADR
jgi:hemoglobin